jgi:outer membrane protein insertion porin family
MRYRFAFACILGLFLLAVAPFAGPSGSSPQAYAQTVGQIAVEGNQRVEPETVLSYLQINRGDPFDPVAIDESVKTLFQTGLFSDVQIFRRGNTLIVRVEENPIVNRVNFEGNSEINDDDLAKEVELRERIVFTRAKAQSDTRRILALYQRTGFYSVRVAPKIIRLPQNRIDLVFEIAEGSETKVGTIEFAGNEAFSDGDLRGVIVTKEAAWWRFFTKSTTYDPDRLEFDKELVRRHYLKNGFADAKVLSADARLSDAGDRFVITFTVEEGPRYRIADVAVNIGDTNLDPDRLKKGVKTGVGDDYDASKVDKTVENLTLEAAKQGFVFAKVEPDIQRNEADASLNIVYNLSEGTRTYIERIDIVGNTRTLDEVIRRELRLFEGDAYNRVLVDRARRRLTALDFFEKIDFREDPGSAPDKIVLVVEVVEKSTGSISFSAGYSSTEAVVGSVELTERNLLGRGQFLKLNTTLSFKRQSVDFSFTEPYFLGMPISAGVDLFATLTDNTSISSYKSEQIGGALRAGFRLDEYSTMNFKYGLAYRKITGIDETEASPTIIASEGSTIKSALGATYTWDDLDNPTRPTTGFRGQIDSEVAGLGGDVYYGKLEGHAFYFLPVYEEDVVLKLEANAGHIEGFGSDDVPIQDRFYKGADSFRGFAKSGVGPRQIGNDGDTDAIGGQTYAIGTVELTFPVGLPDEWGIEGAAFTDFGTVFNAPENSVPNGVAGCTRAAGCTVFDTTDFRLAVGAGLIWQSPFGPLRVDASYPLLKASYDETEWFRFSIGTRF